MLQPPLGYEMMLQNPEMAAKMLAAGGLPPPPERGGGMGIGALMPPQVPGAPVPMSRPVGIGAGANPPPMPKGKSMAGGASTTPIPKSKPMGPMTTEAPMPSMKGASGPHPRDSHMLPQGGIPVPGTKPTPPAEGLAPGQADALMAISAPAIAQLMEPRGQQAPPAAVMSTPNAPDGRAIMELLLALQQQGGSGSNPLAALAGLNRPL